MAELLRDMAAIATTGGEARAVLGECSRLSNSVSDNSTSLVQLTELPCETSHEVPIDLARWNWGFATRRGPMDGIVVDGLRVRARVVMVGALQWRWPDASTASLAPT